jgi:hypothetical protein
MTRRTVRIETLRIRIPASQAGRAATLARGIGQSILHGMADAAVTGKRGGSLDGTSVTLRARHGEGARALEERAAAQVTRALRKGSE